MRELKEVKILIISGPWDQQLIQGGVEMVWEMTKSCASLSLYPLTCNLNPCAWVTYK